MNDLITKKKKNRFHTKKDQIYSVKLPEDNTIQYRDILSTLLNKKGIPKNEETNFDSLPRQVKQYLLSFAKPNEMTVEAANKEIVWNNNRFNQRGNFFKPAPSELNKPESDLSAMPRFTN